MILSTLYNAPKLAWALYWCPYPNGALAASPTNGNKEFPTLQNSASPEIWPLAVFMPNFTVISVKTKYRPYVLRNYW